MPSIILARSEYFLLCSFILSVSVVGHAFYTKKQFYPSIVYLTKSSSSLAVLYIQALMFMIFFGKLVQKMFLGPLRAIEIEHLYDRMWFSITETCLAFTVFRDDFSPVFVALFAVLLFLKSFHWLLEDRVDYMEQSPILGLLFHARMIGLSTVLLMLDYRFIWSAYTYTMIRGPSAQIVFGFEYAILLICVFSIALKYMLHSIEIHTGEQWENKGVFMLYSDLILGFGRVLLYMIFMLVMMKIHTFPLFSIRPMFIAMKAFRKSCNDVIESRRAIRNLNTMYPDLTAEDLHNVRDMTCIICREEMQVQQSIKRLSCQHIFHKHCLRSWFQRQQTCPICRTAVLRTTTPAQDSDEQAPQQDHPDLPNDAEPNPNPRPSSSASNFISNAATNTERSNPPFSFGSPSMVFPPYAFPPPPLPPLNFDGMSEEAIRTLEQTELAHVQVRLQCLRNVRSLLDASVSHMEQYMNAITASSSQPMNGNQSA